MFSVDRLIEEDANDDSLTSEMAQKTTSEVGTAKSGRRTLRSMVGARGDSSARRSGKRRAQGGGKLADFVVITGMSGAGKSEAMACFEDAGYFCVDNLPPQMIASLAELLNHKGASVERAAVVSDARGGQYFEQFADVMAALDESGVDHRMIFLDADDQSLINRFKETRRRHPLAPQGSIAEGISEERRLLEPLPGLADQVIDTTELSAQELRRYIAGNLLGTAKQGKLSVTFATYGFKYGPPRDVDLAFDVRFLPNPHYVPDLRKQTGLDQQVRDYVQNVDGIGEFYERLIPLLDFLLDAYRKEGKAHLNVGIGCTGGRHRSVVIAEYLAELYRDREQLDIQVTHRDIEKASRR